TETYVNTLTALGLTPYTTDEQAAKFEVLYQNLVDFNSHTNLTAITDEAGVSLRHFADSLTAAPYIGEHSLNILDVGCGGGFPTLPLAIARSDCRFTALDSTAKKLNFVAQMAALLSLPITTLPARAEEVAVTPDHREQYDLVVSRAVARLPMLCELCLPFVKVGGRFVALKGADGEIELAEAERAITKLGGKLISRRSFTLGEAGGRVILEIEKVRPTPAAYPRAFAKIKKAPL
ncbi:MAG: 16S rRNA (guanine(527)-N(7))-methyltransferase RsmG, partial [Clostridia bacterium]|nr:16S rRNA (guanine(527)-N(7))-methyltransferase RsmG [Clostridia bacterium]